MQSSLNLNTKNNFTTVEQIGFSLPQNKEEVLRYDFKLFIANTDVLVFRAFIVNANSYHIIPVEGFNIDKIYKNLFLRIIEGKLSLKYFDKSQIRDGEVPNAKYITINREDAIANIEQAKHINPNLLGVKIECEQM